jgi:hypothetical protein
MLDDYTFPELILVMEEHARLRGAELDETVGAEDW